MKSSKKPLLVPCQASLIDNTIRDHHLRKTMPLPDHALTLTGGCNCNAIRYKITIPAFADRPLCPTARVSQNIRLPIVCTDHCNDCRAATASILTMWIFCPFDMISISCVPRSSAPTEGKLAKTEAWRPSSEMIDPSKEAEADNFLRFFKSSAVAARVFCGRCGTPLAFQDWPPGPGQVGTLDLLVGTMDREFFDGEVLAPERHVWWKSGVDWIQKMVLKGAGDIPKHPTNRRDEEV